MSRFPPLMDWSHGKFGDVIEGPDGSRFMFIAPEPKTHEFSEALTVRFWPEHRAVRFWLTEIFNGMWLEPEIEADEQVR
jgi:hypothetical protein